jgi:hypothetical protein
MPAQSTPSVIQFIGQNGADGVTLGNNAASLVGMHGAASIQQSAASTPVDLATSITAITQINLILKNKGLTP